MNDFKINPNTLPAKTHPRIFGNLLPVIHFIFPLLILHKIEKSCTLMSEGYLSLGDKQGTDEALNNIFPAKTDVLPGYDPFQCLVVLQRHWQKFMEFTGKEEIRSNIWEIIENGTGKDIVD